MMKAATSVSVRLIPLALALACSVGCNDGRESDDAVADITNQLVLKCQTLHVLSGRIGSGQTATALGTAELSGTQDVWDDYVEFSPATSAVCSFSLPSTVSVAAISALSLGVNYRGPQKSDMVWTFAAWDAVAGAWVNVADNSFASDWIWSAATPPLPAPAARFFANGVLQVRYATTSSYDASDLDQLVVNVTLDTTTSPADMATASPADMATTSPADLATPLPGSHWQPHPGTSWQWQLSGTLDTSLNVQMYDIDLFDNSASVIAGLKAQGRKVICYFSAGTYENWRPDASSFPSSVIGNAVQGWPGENWLDTRAQAVRDIMSKRMDLAVQKGCDGIEPDNVDGYTNKPGFPLTYQTQIDYNTFLANSAHARNLAVALKNDLDQIQDLLSYFDFALNEQCFQYSECGALQPFINANKAVFEVEYGSSSLVTKVCPQANSLNFDTLIKNLDLDAWRISCR
jgi:hypothetical protein